MSINYRSLNRYLNSLIKANEISDRDEGAWGLGEGKGRRVRGKRSKEGVGQRERREEWGEG